MLTVYLNSNNVDHLDNFNIKFDNCVIDITNKTHWTERDIGKIILKGNPNDEIIAYDASDLACSITQLLEIFKMALERGIDIHFKSYNEIFIGDTSLIDAKNLLNLLAKIESDFISKRTSEALERRRVKGLPLGRPLGKKNKSLKLDKYKNEIKDYLSLGISKASIARLVGCHPQTLYDWLDRQKPSFLQEQ